MPLKSHKKSGLILPVYSNIGWVKHHKVEKSEVDALTDVPHDHSVMQNVSSYMHHGFGLNSTPQMRKKTRRNVSKLPTMAITCKFRS